MDDRFLHEHRCEPAPGFARSLRARLRQVEDVEADAKQSRWKPALVATFAVAVVALSFMLPSVRATAQNLLDLFRVRTFAPVAFDPAKLDKLKALTPKDGEGGPNMLFANVEVLEKPEAPQTFTSLGSAASAAGIPGRAITEFPRDLKVTEIAVTGQGRTRFQVDTGKLTSILEALDIHDLQVPTELNGRSFTVEMPRAIRQHLEGKGREAEFLQAASPEIQLPAGTDLSRLGEIGLRVLGMDSKQARSMARSIDWTSTMVVPVPLDATTFREVTIQGQKGLLITGEGTAKEPGGRKRMRNLLLWSDSGRLYALMGDVTETDLVEMAESVR